MYKIQESDMYKFIDDGVNRSIYSILSDYHPYLKKNFSLSSLINNLPELGEGFNATYEKNVKALIELLMQKTRISHSQESNDGQLSDEERKVLLEEFKEASKDDPEGKLLVSIGQFLTHAQTSLGKPETKPLRDVIVNNAVRFLPAEEISESRNILMKCAYVPKARGAAKSVNTRRREPGQYPEFDTIETIIKILQVEGLDAYDAFYDRASEQIRTAALAAMQKARIEVVCDMKRTEHVKNALAASNPVKDAVSGEPQTKSMFEKLKRLPEKGESEWKYTSFEKPRLLCDLEANYAENGEENQRVIAFRYGKFTYKNANNSAPIALDETDTMPELVGITRIGNDGTHTYFVLMPPLTRYSFRSVNDKTMEPGDKKCRFVATETIKERTRSGNKMRKVTKPTTITDFTTKEPMNVFVNDSIPEHLKDFYAKVFFSDEYLRNAISYNARYIGRVVETENGPVIMTADSGRMDLQAAHYAQYHPGVADDLRRESFNKYCMRGGFDTKQFNLVYDLERAKRQDGDPKKGDPKKGDSKKEDPKKEGSPR